MIYPSKLLNGEKELSERTDELEAEISHEIKNDKEHYKLVLNYRIQHTAGISKGIHNQQWDLSVCLVSIKPKVLDKFFNFHNLKFITRIENRIH